MAGELLPWEETGMRGRHFFLPILIAGSLAMPEAGRAISFTPPLPVPVTEIITVQPIEVCASSTTCLPMPNLATYAQYANSIFDQAGVGFAFLSPTEYINPAFTNITATITSAYPSGTPTDLAHQLMYGAGHGQSINPTTLNVWFVDTLTRSDHVGLYGQGFIGGNGIVMPLLPSPDTKQVPAIDTLTHELGHNLGLAHVDGTFSGSQYDLMQSVGRVVPSNPCQINPYSCSSSGKATDMLNSAQIATVQNPLFTVDLAHATAQTIPGGCVTGASVCDINISFENSPTTESLLAFKVRFLNSSSVLSPTIVTGSSPQGIKGTLQTYGLSPTGAAVEYDFASGVFLNGDSFILALNYGRGGVASSPFSVEFDFSSGITSAALFDGTGFASSNMPDYSDNPIDGGGLGFIGTPTYGIGKHVPVVACLDVEGDQATGEDSSCSFAPVPEPSSGGLLLGSLLVAGLAAGCVRARARSG